MRKIFTIFIIFLNFIIFSQSFQLKAVINNKDQDCDLDLKQISIIHKNKDIEVVLHTFQDTSCVLNQKLELKNGTYKLKVKSILLNFIELDFTINNNTNLIIDFGTITLINQTAQLDEVTITGIPKKFIVHDAEKTIVSVEKNTILERGTLYEAITKIPGIIPSPGGGFTYSGQAATTFFEGIPSSLNGIDLDNLLKSLPAISVKNIELVTNPGASYDASFNGVIIDIISHEKSFKWLSGTISLNVGLNDNLKMIPTFLLNGKAKKFTWNIQNSYSYQEKNSKEENNRKYTFLDSLNEFNSIGEERFIVRTNSIRGNIMSKISKKSVLQLNAGYNYYLNQMHGESNVSSNIQGITPYNSIYNTKGNGFTFDAGLKYRISLDTFDRKIEFSSNYSKNSYNNLRDLNQLMNNSMYSRLLSNSFSDRYINRIDLELPLKNKKNQFNLGVKISNFSANNRGSYRLNDSIPIEVENDYFYFSLPFKYKEQNLAFYSEYKKRIKESLSLTFGLRAEDFSFLGKVQDVQLVKRSFFNLYPSVHGLYRINSDMSFLLSYARKISLPNYSMYDPNLSGYYDSYTQNTGNNSLEPNFSHRTQAKLTIFDYLQISLTHNFSNSINLGEVFVDSATLGVNYTYRTYANVQNYSGFFTLPVPFGMFTQGFDFFRNPVDVDAISFLYLYTNVDKTYIPGYNYLSKNKALWTFGVYSQIILPLKIRLNIEYNYSAKGMYNNSQAIKNIHELELVLSREFLKDKWRVSASFQDVFNSSQTLYQVDYVPLTAQFYNKWDTRVVWLKLAYSFGKYERPSLKEDAIPNGKGG